MEKKSYKFNENICFATQHFLTQHSNFKKLVQLWREYCMSFNITGYCACDCHNDHAFAWV